MVLIKTKLRTIPIRFDDLKEDIEKILQELGYGDFDIGVLLTTDKTIQRYNKKYRAKDRPTDILSFPFYADLRGQNINAKTVSEKNLGDIIISLEKVIRDAQKMNVPLEVYLRKIVVHGICHLLGYTHDTENNYRQMLKKENDLLDLLNIHV